MKSFLESHVHVFIIVDTYKLRIFIYLAAINSSFAFILLSF